MLLMGFEVQNPFFQNNCNLFVTFLLASVHSTPGLHLLYFLQLFVIQSQHGNTLWRAPQHDKNFLILGDLG